MKHEQNIGTSSVLFRILPALILAVGLGATLLVWHNSRHREAAVLRDEIDVLADKTQSIIIKRLNDNIQILRGAAGLFAASENVSRQEFRSYVAALRLDERYPGIQGVGFALVVPAAELERHLRQIRGEGFPEYAVRPPGARDLYTAIIYLEPFSGRNLRAFGYDMFSEPIRNAAMSRARDAAQPAMTGKVTLVQETTTDVQPGFLLYEPIYRNGAPHATPAERRANLVGWAYSPLRMRDMMQGVLREQLPEVGTAVNLQIYDGTKISPATFMFASEGEVNPRGSDFEAHRQIQAGGHVWTLRLRSLPPFDARSNSERDTIILSSGSALSLLLALLAWVPVRSRERIASALRQADQANRELAASEERFRSYFELGLIGMALTSPEKGWVQVNDRLCQILGYPREELVGMTWLELTHPDDVAMDSAQFQRVMSGEIDGYALEKRFIRKDGSVIDASIAATCQRRPDGTVQQFVAFVDDITDRKFMGKLLQEYSENLEKLITLRTAELEEANRELELRRDQAEAANRAKSMFLATMSHELRTPLNSILGLSETLRDGILGALNEKQFRALLTVEESGRHLLELITDILDLSKIEADRMEAEFVKVDVDEICRSSLRFVREAALKKRIALTFTTIQAPETLRSDLRRLKQILVNLLGNAVKFTPDNGRIGLEVAGDRARGEVRFTVWDTGIGIAADDLTKLFQPFVQVDSSLARRYEGTGLGLSLVARLTDMLGGVITVDSTPGVGSRFNVIMPWASGKGAPERGGGGP